MLLLQQLTRAREKSVLKSRLTFGLTNVLTKIDVEYLEDVEYPVHLAKIFFETSISVNLIVNRKAEIKRKGQRKMKRKSSKKKSIKEKGPREKLESIRLCETVFFQFQALSS
jgi:hypothetical protein